MKSGLGEPYEAYKGEPKSFLMSFLGGRFNAPIAKARMSMVRTKIVRFCRMRMVVT